MSELPDGWARSTAGELCIVIGGATPRTDTPAYWGGDVPWITPDDLSRDKRQYVDGGRRSLTPEGLQSCAAALVPSGTVLFTSRAPIGYAAIASAEVATNQGFKSLVPPLGLRSDFLYWQLRHLTPTIKSMGSGTTFAEVSKKVMEAVPLRVAPLPEQTWIVAAIEEAFSKLDAGEAGLRASSQRLKRMRDAVFIAALAGQLTAQDPDDTPAARVLADLGVNAMGSADLPTLPRKWAWARVQDVGEVDLGRQRSPKYHRGPNMKPYLRVANVFEDRIDTSDVKQMHFEPQAFERSRLMPGDVLLNEGQTPDLLGRPAMYRGDPPSVAFTNSLLRFKSRIGIAPEWALVVFRGYMRTGRFTQESRITTNIAHLSATRFKQVEFPVPPPEEQFRIVAEVDRELSFIDACERTIDAGLARSAALRRSILKAAFEGKLVPQDPADEPASVLLDRIRAERARVEPGGRHRAKAAT